MNNKTAGWTLGAAALGTMFILMAADIKSLHSLSEMWSPLFLGNMLAHIGNVIMAFIAGKLIPTEPQNQRKDD